MTAAPPAAKRPLMPDAASITGGSGKAKTSSAVDTLLSPTISTSAQSIVDIPVKYVVPHPRNRKILDDDVTDLVASLKAGEPIINPLGVTAAADWNTKRPADLKDISPSEYIITAGGHRRLRAAELAGLTTVPCIVRPDFAGAQGRKAALLENLHRQDLDAFEEAEAFAELTGDPYKLSQRDLAGVVGCNQSHISKRLKLLKLPSSVRAAVAVGKATVIDALELARVADQGPIFDLAWERYQRNSWTSGKDAVDAALRDHQIDIQRTQTLDALKAADVPVVKQSPQWYPQGRGTATRLEGLKLDPSKHVGEVCDGAYVDAGGNAIPLCLTPGNHLKAGPSKLKVGKSVEQDILGRGNNLDAAVRRDRKELKALYPGRAAIARQIVHGSVTLDPGPERELVTRGLAGAAFHGQGRAETWKVVLDLVAPLELATYPTSDATDELLARLPMPAAQRALALSYFEARIRSPHSEWGSDGRFYLNLLTEHGYHVTALERKKLAKPTNEPANQCRVCHGDNLDNGVTWVAPDLCSACSDAEAAGWVDREHVNGVNPDLQDALRDGTALKAQIDAEAVPA